MAQTMIGSVYGLVSNEGKNINGGNDAQLGFVAGNIQSISAARVRLAAISGTTYTADVLNTMTYNDMMYAIRVNDFLATVN